MFSEPTSDIPILTITPKCLHKVSEQQIHTLTVNRTSMRQGVDGQPSALMVDIPIYQCTNFTWHAEVYQEEVYNRFRHSISSSQVLYVVANSCLIQEQIKLAACTRSGSQPVTMIYQYYFPIQSLNNKEAYKKCISSSCASYYFVDCIRSGPTSDITILLNNFYYCICRSLQEVCKI